MSNDASRRRALKQLASLSALGAINGIRSTSANAAEANTNSIIPGLKGKAIRREDPNYETWRSAMIWHRNKSERYPDMIVQAQSEEDVIAAVKYAAKNKLKISMRSGGHNSNGTSVRDNGLVLDLSALDEIIIDEKNQVASVQPGVRSAELIAAAGKKGLSFPVPHCPSVGISGFTMGGGIGWNYPQTGGMSTFSIIGAEVITANGRKVTVNAKKNPDLYWAIRGSGPGFFGVVTRLLLQLYPAPKTVMASSYIFPLDKLDKVTQTFESIRKNHDTSRVEPIIVLMHHPDPDPKLAERDAKICFFSAFAFEDSEEAARAALEPFAQSDFATESVMKVEMKDFSYEGLYDRFFSLEDPAGKMSRYAADNVLSNKGSDTLKAMAEHVRNAPSRDCHLLASFNKNLRHHDDACFSWVADCFVGCYAIWDYKKDDKRAYDWMKEAGTIMNPFAVGHYVNEVLAGRTPSRFVQCFTEENWSRLESLRNKYDPSGVFHHYLDLG